MRYFFDQYSEFIEFDSRRDRGYVPITSETLTKRHEVALPKSLIRGARILDLGSCLGATGAWSLAHGAASYTGVEVQPLMAETSNNLLSKHWSNYTIVNQDIESFLKNNNEHFDVVVMFGVIYVFLNIYEILKQISKIANTIVIDSSYPSWAANPDAPVLDLTKTLHINSAELGKAFSGVGIRPNPGALRLMLETLGFEDTEGLLYPTPLDNKEQHDAYITSLKREGFKSTLPARYMLRFVNTGKNTLTVKDAVINNNVSTLSSMKDKPATAWKFDSAVAGRFQDEADKHIPDYQRVINLTVGLIKQIYKPSAKIIDVGSALGYTVDTLISAGYSNTVGCECSQDMINQSKHRDKIILSSSLPPGPWDIVIANWTLHFIQHRREYLEDIYTNLNPGGMLILTDKMSHSNTSENLYHQFKRSKGVTDEEIGYKKNSLLGVLTTKPINWYLETLKEIGFDDIQIINTAFMFSTIYARRY